MLQRSPNTRTTESSVTFSRPFRLGRDARELPAGTYRLYTHEDLYEGAFEPVYVASSIELIVRASSGATSRIVLPSEFAAALALDAAQGGSPEDRFAGQQASTSGTAA